MFKFINVSLADLLLDQKNARFRDEQPNQQAAMLALARLESRELLKQAEDIVNFGLDPLALPGLVEVETDPGRYVVIEGNRRVLALKALENPALVTPALGAAGKRRIVELSKKFATQPILVVPAVLFEEEGDLAHWVTLRHTGANEGVGLVTWGAREKDAWNRRHGQERVKPEGKILDFVEKAGGLSEEARNSKRKVFTNLGRILSNQDNRRRLGIDYVGTDVVMLFPASEVVKPLTRIVDDLLTGRIKVKNIYDKAQQTEYIDGLGKEDLPDPGKKLKTPRPLNVAEIAQGAKPKPKARDPRTKNATERVTLFPGTFRPKITSVRLQLIYHELATPDVVKFANTLGVMFRVFVELTVDLYVEKQNLIPDKQRRNTSLALKLKAAAKHLHDQEKISAQLRDAVEKVADDKRGALAASVPTFNAFVHNVYAFPKAHVLKLAWDELQPFMEAVFANMPE